MKFWLRNNLWRHAYAIFMCLFALFPLYLVVLSAFSSSGSLKVTSFLPTEFSITNFSTLFNNPAIPYLTWAKNSLIISSFVALVSVFVGASSAFAFSRMRFKGRKFGLQALLLVQVFPSFLALAAIYVMMERVFTVFPQIGLGSLGGLLLIYLGGSMGVNAWLLKGYIDTIPMELDEAARIDGYAPMACLTASSSDCALAPRATSVPASAAIAGILRVTPWVASLWQSSIGGSLLTIGLMRQPGNCAMPEDGIRQS